MKYEPSAQQYANFLNSLPQKMVAIRDISRAEGYVEQGGAIYFKNGQFQTPYPEKTCQFMGWNDAMAFADWAGLRPMTELEFTKAARGPGKPLPGEFPWNSSQKAQIQRMPNASGVLEMRNGWTENRLSENTRVFFGASYYWVMDLAGSMWERVVSIGHPKGRSFIGTHGDGVLSPEGEATNKDWPYASDEGGGFGFRGGGFYGYFRSYHEYNPFSPIAYRPYGGWSGGDRTNAYGARFVRTKE